MSEPVIHIGLPKTATMTLQDHVFPLAPLSLGKRLRWSSSTRFAAELSHLCAAMPDRPLVCDARMVSLYGQRSCAQRSRLKSFACQEGFE